MEFEASFNDATGLIVFSSIIALVFASAASTGNNIMGNSSSSAITSPKILVFLTLQLFLSLLSTMNNLSFVGETEHFAIVFFGGAAIGLAIAGSHTDYMH